MKIVLPDYVEYIINKLENAGFEAYAVGGCVRDSFLGRKPDDWDVTTSALPAQVKALFRRTVDTGIEHGTVTVLVSKDSCEVTTYRLDGEYEDFRHPKKVEFTRSLEEDLKRRDFTINAMAYNPKRGLIDLFGGCGDLDGKLIRAVGVPEERFNEDALRILRAVRFSAQLGFELDEATRSAMKKMAPNLEAISAERIRVELEKLITSDNPGRLEDAYELGLTKVFMPEFDRMMETEQHTPHHIYSVGVHTIKAMENIEPDRILRLVMLFHDMGKPEMKTTDETGRDHFKKHALRSVPVSEEIMKRLRFDNDTIKIVKTLVLYHDWRCPSTPQNVRRLMSQIGKEKMPMLIKIQYADLAAQSDYGLERKRDRIVSLDDAYKEILKNGDCVSLKELAIGGEVIKALGVKPGPMIGELLTAALDEVLECPEHNTKEYLTGFCRNKL